MSSRLKALIEKGLGVLEEIGELDETSDSNVISEAYKKVLEDLERLKYLTMLEERKWAKV
jgi:hypothetical protein